MSVVDRLPIPRPSLPVPDLPLAPGALKYAGLLVLSAVPASLVLPFLGIPLVLGAVFVLYFFRDPARHPPSSGYLAPADGTVSVVEYDEDDADRVRVGIYLGPLDVHVVRSPVGGRVHDVRHEPGGHLPAFTKRSERNEKVHVEFDGTDVTMIAGAVARRITPYVEADREVRRGERVGHIAFGSRTDVVLPASVGPEDIAVEPGESVRAGETVLVPADAIDPRHRREAAGGEADGRDDGGSDGAGRPELAGGASATGASTESTGSDDGKGDEGGRADGAGTGKSEGDSDGDGAEAGEGGDSGPDGEDGPAE